jgi:hypothetical protein
VANKLYSPRGGVWLKTVWVALACCTAGSLVEGLAVF